MKSDRLFLYLLGISAASLIALTFIVIENFENQRYRDSLRSQVLTELSQLRVELEARINEDFHLTRGLIAYVATHPDLEQETFTRIARNLIGNRNSIRNIGLAPENVISFVYPLKGNENALGLDYRANKAQWPAVKRAIDDRKTVVAGPVSLVQGGTAFIVRSPIYQDSEGPDGNGRYWGLASIVIDKEMLFEKSGFNEVAQKLNLAMIGRDGLGIDGGYIYGDESILEQDPVLLKVHLPEGVWQLAAIPIEGWEQSSPHLMWIRSGGITITLLVGLGCVSWLKRKLASHEKLKAALLSSEQSSIALRKNETFLNAIIENIPDMVFVKDAKNLRFVRFNKAGEQLTGYPREKLLGKNDYDFFPKEEADFFTEKDRYVLQNKIIADIPEEVISTANGEEKILHTKKITLLNENNMPEYLLGISEDITEKKKLQEAQMRSSQLSALGEVAAGVAHEINNPINGVINYAQLLINKNDENDSSNQILERIIKEGNRISSIVQNLLNFAQKDRGVFSSLNLMDLVVEPLNLNAQFFKKNSIHIDVGIPDDLPEIYGNQMQLEQVILNLLSNARHALNKRFPEPSNEKFILIDGESLRIQDVEYVQLRIKDSGCGIPKNHIEKVFNPFFTTKEAGVGTGLGMSVSHEILENHGATISIDSQVNKFTMVTITFSVKSES